MRWLSIGGLRFQAVGVRASKDVNKFVAISISNAFFKLSNSVGKVVLLSQERALALGGLNALLLHGDYLSPKMRELSLKFIGGRGDLCFIKRLHSRFVGVNPLGDARE